VAECVATDVAIIGSVGQSTDAHTVENDPSYTVEDGHVTSLRESRET
jgi:hypothetical protein